MKQTYLSILGLSIVLSFAGCQAPSNSTNHNSHAGMNHNAAGPMDHGAANAHHDMDHSAMQSSPNAAAADHDLQYIDTMIAHHQGAVDMARPCQTLAVKAEMKKLCAEIIESQTKEIAEMRSWRDKWFAGKEPAINMQMPGMNESMVGMDMKKLNSLSGIEFDLEFIRQMIPHHQGAVVMAKDVLSKTNRDEIKRISNEIIKAQEEEIKQMKEWQAAWSK
jgi:uncharacterized protein (DUF305 family)